MLLFRLWVLGFRLSAGQIDFPGQPSGAYNAVVGRLGQSQLPNLTAGYGGYNMSAHTNLQYGGDAGSIVRHSIQTAHDITGRIHAMIAAGAHRGMDFA
ncbi:SPON1 [Symbiodinium necroappetens]|uniref:SPON1 protein n=1 Tax=Symbiodinium necroappetens TaxID=1628268 RepID=A0A812JKA0_9DINO|nr:SPON1 [Symbiodinium necroappetens]